MKYCQKNPQPFRCIIMPCPLSAQLSDVLSSTNKFYRDKVSYVYRFFLSAAVLILLVNTEFQYLLNNLHLSSWKFRDDIIFQDGTNI